MGVTPYDGQEIADQNWMLDWIDSGAPLFRTAKPATPPRHLAVYAALLDQPSRSLMLVDHAKAKAWLSIGGHVDPEEDPRDTVVRELKEEATISPPFDPRFGSDAFFLTVTQTRGLGSHIDATLWFVFAADRTQGIVPDPAEFSAARWFSLDDPAVWKGEFDPQMFRFLDKLNASLELASAA